MEIGIVAIKPVRGAVNTYFLNWEVHLLFNPTTRLSWSINIYYNNLQIYWSIFGFRPRQNNIPI